jgi:hypothetical protein
LCIAAKIRPTDVRSGSFSTNSTRLCDVRLSPGSGHWDRRYYGNELIFEFGQQYFPEVATGTLRTSKNCMSGNDASASFEDFERYGLNHRAPAA